MDPETGVDPVNGGEKKDFKTPISTLFKRVLILVGK
jgi:hypothetical protein